MNQGLTASDIYCPICGAPPMMACLKLESDGCFNRNHKYHHLRAVAATEIKYYYQGYVPGHQFKVETKCPRILPGLLKERINYRLKAGKK